MTGLKLAIIACILLAAGCSAYSQPFPYRDASSGPNVYCSMDPPNQPGCR